MNSVGIIYIIAALISYAIEPYIWIMILTKTFKRKADSRILYMLAWFGGYIIICVKQYLSFVKSGNEVLLLILLICYYFIVFRKLFNCRRHELMICLSVLFIVALISESVSIGIILLVTRFGITDMSQIGLANIMLTLISKGVLILVAAFYVKIRDRNFTLSRSQIELGPILFGCVLWEVPCVAIFNNMKWIGDSTIIFFWLVLGQIFLIALVIYMKRLIDHHNSRELEYEIRIEKSKVEMELSRGINTTLEELYKVKHEMLRQTNMMLHLYENNDIVELGSMLKKMLNNINEVEKYYTFTNANVAALLNQKRAEAIRNNIEFDAELMIDNFKLKDEDIYSVISNLLENAIEASKLVPEKEGFVNLKIIQEEEGYTIECVNSFSVTPIRRQSEFVTTKKTKKGHGLGIKIIKNIVREYEGTSKFDFAENTFTATIYIPYN